jgi:putative nucleotidyltransferase with HDIG domain
MDEDLKELLPELAEIGDAGLRARVAAVYAVALARGGWRAADMARMPFTLLLEPCPASYLEHTRAVTKTALAAGDALAEIYGERLPLDRDVLAAAALLHDVGKLVEYAEEGGAFVKSASGELLRHPFAGAALCQEFGLPVEVTHVVATHAREGEGARATAEAIIVHHADFINFEPFKL